MTPMLVQRQRPDRAFERLYRRHVGDVYRYAFAVLRNPADAEDVTQTTFLNAYRAMQRGEQPRTPQNWLIAIAHNVCRQRFRQSASRPDEVTLNEELVEAVVADDDAPTADDIRRALAYLPFNQRSALVMRELEGRSYAEIAEILGLSLEAVEALLFRARRALREQLEGGFTCHEAEAAISRQLDGRLARAERGRLRAHLRECKECATFARSVRAQRSAWKALAAIPLPSSLSALFGGAGGGGAAAATGAAAGTGLAAKAAAVVAAGALVAGAGYEAVERAPWSPEEPPAEPRSAAAKDAQAPRAPSVAPSDAAAFAAPSVWSSRAPAAARAPRPVGARPRAQPGGPPAARGRGTGRVDPPGRAVGRPAWAGRNAPPPGHAKSPAKSTADRPVTPARGRSKAKPKAPRRGTAKRDEAKAAPPPSQAQERDSKRQANPPGAPDSPGSRGESPPAEPDQPGSKSSKHPRGDDAKPAPPAVPSVSGPPVPLPADAGLQNAHHPQR